MGLGAHRFLVVAIALLGAAVALGQSVQEIARLGLSSTVTLVSYDEYGRVTGNGSGFVVAPGLFLTNFHVIEDAYDVSAHPTGESRGAWIGSAILLDARLDLALLAFDLEAGPPLELRRGGRPEIGETVYAVGSPLGLEGTFTQGIVSSYRDAAGVPLMQITAPVSPGSSGGPVLDAAGQVVGVVVSSIQDGQNINFAIPVEQVRGFLARLDARPAAPPPRSAAPAPVHAGPPTPGFDCAYAATWSEKAICSSHALAALDVRLNEVFQAVREQLPEAAFEAVYQEQMAWLPAREACEAQGPNLQEACLAAVIRDRIAVLEGYE